MKSEQLVRVFDTAEMLRDAVKMLCRDRLPRGPQATNPLDEEERNTAVDQLCWDLIALQSKNFPFHILIEKCSACLSRSRYADLRYLRAEEVANEISSPVSGW